MNYSPKADITSVSGNIVDVLNLHIYPGTLHIIDGRIAGITEDRHAYSTYIIPGLIDAHIHIESSMLVPSEFARLASVHGTVATVSDPHEIGNVLGIDGVKFMIDNSGTVPFKFYFGAPSCVPATLFETAGAKITLADIESLFRHNEVKFLSEMMNVPGVLSQDPIVWEKIKLAKEYGKRIDGHAPGLQREDSRRYIEAGISTDHECTTKEEALEKINYGMNILIREGSAAKDFNELHTLVEDYSDFCMFCSDDKHPDDLVRGHINKMVKRAMSSGLDRMKILTCACVNPVKHYGLDVGLLQTNDPADFVVIDNFENFNILGTYVDGQLIAENGKTNMVSRGVDHINHFNTGEKCIEDFTVPQRGDRISVIQAVDGQIITKKISMTAKVLNNNVVSDVERDILKIAVVNRYRDATPAIGFIWKFGLKEGAIASSVAHDSHNIVAVGVSDSAICRAVNLIIKNKGGISAVSAQIEKVLSLPIAGIMTDEDGHSVAEQYSQLDNLAKSLGSKLHTPFMTLSFMTLLVIPELKLSYKGLFDSEKFDLIPLFE